MRIMRNEVDMGIEAGAPRSRPSVFLKAMPDIHLTRVPAAPVSQVSADLSAASSTLARGHHETPRGAQGTFRAPVMDVGVEEAIFFFEKS